MNTIQKGSLRITKATHSKYIVAKGLYVAKYSKAIALHDIADIAIDMFIEKLKGNK